MRPGIGARAQDRHIQLPEIAVMSERTFGPGPNDDRLGLVEAGLRLVVVDAETLIIVDVVGAAAAETDDELPLGQIVEDRKLLGQADRVMQRGLQDGEAEGATLQRDGQRAGETDRVGIGADAIEMCSPSQTTSTPSSSDSTASRKVSSMTMPSRSG